MGDLWLGEKKKKKMVFPPQGKKGEGHGTSTMGSTNFEGEKEKDVRKREKSLSEIMRSLRGGLHFS